MKVKRNYGKINIISVLQYLVKQDPGVNHNTMKNKNEIAMVHKKARILMCNSLLIAATWLP